MDRILQVDDRMYEVQMDDRMFAKVVHLVPQQQHGMVADWLEEITGHPSYSCLRCRLTEHDLIEFALRLGRNYYEREAWRNLYDWAEMKARENGVDLEALR